MSTSPRASKATPDSPPADTLPDFRSLGVMLRILLGVNAALVFAAAVRAQTLTLIPNAVLELSAWVEPVLLTTVVLLYAAARPLLRLKYLTGAAIVGALAMLVTTGYSLALQRTGIPMFESAGHWTLHIAYAAFATGVMLIYFRLRERAFSPALAEARLQALQARIRPHFLFNSLNAVLSLVRSDPRRAESALQDMAELFRTLMADNRTLSTLGEEVTLTRQYLNIEHLRLGERLTVEWKIDPRAEIVPVPPLMLQPLVENAVYHGVEPGVGPGHIDIVATLHGEELRLQVTNPYHPEHQHRQGNRMAMANIGERLRLHFDVEAKIETRIETKATGDRFEIRVTLPNRKIP
jgi:two-component system sensor histidine kinase AlgZ